MPECKRGSSPSRCRSEGSPRRSRLSTSLLGHHEDVVRGECARDRPGFQPALDGNRWPKCAAGCEIWNESETPMLNAADTMAREVVQNLAPRNQTFGTIVLRDARHQDRPVGI